MLSPLIDCAFIKLLVIRLYIKFKWVDILFILVRPLTYFKLESALSGHFLCLPLWKLDLLTFWDDTGYKVNAVISVVSPKINSIQIIDFWWALNSITISGISGYESDPTPLLLLESSTIVLCWILMKSTRSTYYKYLKPFILFSQNGNICEHRNWHSRMYWVFQNSNYHWYPCKFHIYLTNGIMFLYVTIHH